MTRGTLSGTLRIIPSTLGGSLGFLRGSHGSPGRVLQIPCRISQVYESVPLVCRDQMHPLRDHGTLQGTQLSISGTQGIIPGIRRTLSETQGTLAWISQGPVRPSQGPCDPLRDLEILQRHAGTSQGPQGPGEPSQQCTRVPSHGQVGPSQTSWRASQGPRGVLSGSLGTIPVTRETLLWIRRTSQGPIGLSQGPREPS